MGRQAQNCAADRYLDIENVTTYRCCEADVTNGGIHETGAGSGIFQVDIGFHQYQECGINGDSSTVRTCCVCRHMTLHYHFSIADTMPTSTAKMNTSFKPIQVVSRTYFALMGYCGIIPQMRLFRYPTSDGHT